MDVGVRGSLAMRQPGTVDARERSMPDLAGSSRLLSLALLAGCLAAAGAAPEPVEAPRPETLRVVPARAKLRGPDAVQQLAVERLAPDGAVRDATAGADFATSDASVATVDASGTIAAKGDGSAT